MDLKKAIERVAKVCPAKKGLEQYRYIRFVPQEDKRGFLFATDGVVSSVCYLSVDIKIPNVLLDADLLVKATKASGILEIEEVGYGHVEIRAVDDGQPGRLLYKTKALNHDKYPLPPLLPERGTFESYDWPAIKKVMGAAAKETGADPQLAVVNFTPDWVEATDKGWLARVEIRGHLWGLVPIRAFKNWPKGKVLLASFTSSHAFFSVGYELRIATLESGDFPETRNVVPTIHPGPSILLHTESMQEAVKQGTKVSDLGLINIAIEPEQIVVRAWKDSEVSDAFEAVVPIRRGMRRTAAKSGNVLVNGKNLERAMKEIKTPVVCLGYGGAGDPLRMESGNFVSCFWQMAY